jgi:hypothetical protein
MTQALLEGRWGETKDALLEGLNGSKRTTMGVILENTRKHLAENATAGATSAGNVATLNRVILPVIRRVMPTVIANEIVGVQPMTGPVAQIHTLRVRYAETTSPTAASPFDTGTTAGDEALSPFKIATAYSGSLTTGHASSTSSLEGVPGRKINVQILSKLLKLRHVSCLHVGHSKLHKTHSLCTVWTSKQKLWLLWHKKSQLKSTKRS